MKPHALLALAIEDRVDLCFQRDARAAIVHLKSGDIPESGDYFTAVRALIETLLRELVNAHGGSEDGRLFDTVAATAVSVCGVVENHRRVLQCRRMEPPDFSPDRSGRKPKPLFDFEKELARIAQKIAGKSWPAASAQRFGSTAYVVNDATACAAYEASLDEKEHRANSLYVKCHAGINIGTVLPKVGTLGGVSANHPEACHTYAALHLADQAAGFNGICSYHGCCLEGMASAHAFTMRARAHPAFGAWKPALDALTAQGLTGRQLDSAFVRYVLAEKPSGKARHSQGVELLAHYLGLTMHGLILATSPDKVILGGRMATPAVLTAIKENIRAWTRDYPWRDSLTAEGIDRTIIRGTPTENGEIEVRGALFLASLRPSGTVVPFPIPNGKSKSPPQA